MKKMMVLDGVYDILGIVSCESSNAGLVWRKLTPDLDDDDL